MKVSYNIDLSNEFSAVPNGHLPTTPLPLVVAPQIGPLVWRPISGVDPVVFIPDNFFEFVDKLSFVTRHWADLQRFILEDPVVVDVPFAAAREVEDLVEVITDLLGYPHGCDQTTRCPATVTGRSQARSVPTPASSDERPATHGRICPK